MRKGAVWFTKETLRIAWFAIFEQDSHRIDQADHYALKPKTRQPSEADIIAGRSARFYVNYSHPMDTYLTRMVRDGRMIRKSSGRYMLSREECVRLEFEEAWDIHLKRGARWEGLVYDTKKISASLIDRRRRMVREDDMLVVRTPQGLHESYKHPNQIGWSEVYKALEKYIYFDVKTIQTLASGYVIGSADAAAGRKLSRWLKSGKVRKVLPHLYQSAGFDKWNKERERLQRPFVIETNSWLIEWIAHFATSQHKNPDLGFTARTILAYYEEDAPEDWVSNHLPDRLLTGTVATALVKYVKDGYLKKVGVGYQLSQNTMELFLPLWFDPETYRAEADHVRTIVELASLSLDEAINQTSHRTHSIVVYALMDRIFELPTLETYPPLTKLARKIKQSPAKILKGYQQHKEQNA